MNRQYTDIAYIRRYVNGELSSREMFDLEHAAQQDEMIMDIIMGMEFEKSNRLTNNIDEIRHRIRDRISRKQPAKTFSWTKWAIAASILLVVSIGVYIFLSQREQSHIDIIAYQPQEPKMVENQVIEEKREENILKNTRSGPAISPKDNNTKKLNVTSISTYKPTKQEETHLINIAVDDTTINNPIENINLSYVTHTKDSLHHTDLAMIQPLTNPQAQVTMKSKSYTESPERVRAKLNNMNIDPQTSLVLNQVLNQQAQEQINVTEHVESKRRDTDVVDHNYSYLSNVKSADNHFSKEKKDSGETESSQSVTFGKVIGNKASNPIASHPIDGWKAFDEYLGKALSAHNITSGHFQLEFSIDANGMPRKIKIIHADNNNSNTILIDILQKGPGWIPGNDAEKVNLEVKF